MKHLHNTYKHFVHIKLIDNYKEGISFLGGVSHVCISACGGTFLEDRGTIFSPGFPIGYQNGMLCNYTITTDPQKYVSLTFARRIFELEGCE